MPDYPFVEPSPALPPVGPGGTRIRLFRRRQSDEEPDQETNERDAADNDAAWEELLRQAVAELNETFQRAGAPFTCTLEEEENSFCLSVRRHDVGPAASAVEEEILAPNDLPRWLTRLRLRLGLLVDEKA